MSTKQKIEEAQIAIQRQLESANFISSGNVQIPISFILNNEKPNGAMNVFEVDSKEQAEEISLAIVKNKNIINEIVSYDRPIYLTILVILPR